MKSSINNTKEINNNNLITLENTDGENKNFEFLDLIKYHGREFVVLYPVDSDTVQSGLVLILELESVNNVEETYSSVDDDKILKAVFKKFKKSSKDRFIFE